MMNRIHNNICVDEEKLEHRKKMWKSLNTDEKILCRTLCMNSMETKYKGSVLDTCLDDAVIIYNCEFVQPYMTERYNLHMSCVEGNTDYENKTCPGCGEVSDEVISLGCVCDTCKYKSEDEEEDDISVACSYVCDCCPQDEELLDAIVADMREKGFTNFSKDRLRGKKRYDAAA